MTINSSKICPKYTKCPIFKDQDNTGDVYKHLFCTAGSEKFSTCKRYLVVEKIHKPAPPEVMPNSFMTVKEIIEMMQDNGLL